MLLKKAMEVLALLLLEFQNVCFENEGKSVLNKVTLNINTGEFISVVGPSGSGKSTFFKLCCNLISPTSGNIVFKGKNFMDYDPVELRKSIVYCFQAPLLFGSTVKQNIYYPYSIRGLKPDEKRVNELFSEFHMPQDFLDNDVKNLSGGEKQRIALIRSLLFKPEILLLDEVTSALDKDNTELVEGIINSINKQGVTVLWITHNPEQSRRYAHRLITIEQGEISSDEVLE
jgi:putative ABC transport system ATP-binding protein